MIYYQDWHAKGVQDKLINQLKNYFESLYKGAFMQKAQLNAN